MAIQKNKKRIDPRYFLNETTYRDLDEGTDLKADIAARVQAAAKALSNIGMFVGPLQQSGDHQDQRLAEMVLSVEETLNQILVQLSG